MAHYAFIDDNNVVTEVIVGNDETTGDWETYYGNIRGQVCKRTSYNGNIRFNYAGVGFTFDPEAGEDGGFVPPQPFDSWTLSAETLLWEAPIPYPEDGSEYYWDEDSGDWLEIVE